MCQMRHVGSVLGGRMYAAFLETLADMGFRDKLEKMGAIPRREVVTTTGRKPLADPLLDAIGNRHVCPDCGGNKFTMGPSGGMSQNIKCSNLECGSEFCAAPFENGW